MWFNNSKLTVGGMENENIVKGLWKEIERFEENCRGPASVIVIIIMKIIQNCCVVSFSVMVFFQKLLCTYAFPKCDTKNGYDIALPICYEDCIAVRDLFCYTDWAVIEDNKRRGIFLKSKAHFVLPNCDKLPKYNFNETSPSCSYAGLTEMKTDEITCSCR